MTTTTTAAPGVTHSLTAKIPVLSLYNILIIYLFLPIPRKDVTFASGMTVSLICMIEFFAIEFSVVITYNIMIE